MMLRLRSIDVVIIATYILLMGVTISVLQAGSREFAPFETEGTVLGVKPEEGIVQLDHEPIQGPGFFMNRMQMAFTVEDPALLKGLQPGDRVHFRIQEGRASRIVELRKLAK